MPHDVFISYSRKDIAFARLIQDSLKQSQVDTWIDWERIPIGEKWWSEIREAIQNANVFMFIISKNSIGSSVCKDEINQAIRNNKRVIPIIVDEATHKMLFDYVEEVPNAEFTVDLASQTLSFANGSVQFPIDPFNKTCLLNGTDELGYIMGF